MDEQPKKPRIWPGMPTKGSQLFESLFTVGLPIILCLIGITVALLMPTIQGCLGR
jgi:hypothetical protein